MKKTSNVCDWTKMRKIKNILAKPDRLEAAYEALIGCGSRSRTSRWRKSIEFMDHVNVDMCQHVLPRHSDEIVRLSPEEEWQHWSSTVRTAASRRSAERKTAGGLMKARTKKKPKHAPIVQDLTFGGIPDLSMDRFAEVKSIASGLPEISNAHIAYPLFGPVGQQHPIVGPHNTREWMVPGYLTSSNSRLFMFGWQGGSKYRALWARFVVVMSSASPETLFRLIYWKALPYDPTPVEMGRYRVGDPPYEDSVGIYKAHPMGIDVTEPFNKLIDDRVNAYILWQVKDDGAEWRAWSASLDIYWGVPR